jgi:YqaJ-like viral recombinase domain
MIETIDFDEPEIAQGSEAWRQARVGFITGSRISDIFPSARCGYEKYKVNLAVERLTGIPTPEGFKSARMQQGNDIEEEARESYSFIYGVDVRQVGFIKHPKIPNFGVSPDGLIGNDGGLELKNRDQHIHVPLLLSKKPPRAALLQMYAAMSCCDLDWVDYGSYNDTMPPKLRLIVVRAFRDDKEIAVIEKAVIQFDMEVEDLVNKLRKL